MPYWNEEAYRKWGHTSIPYCVHIDVTPEGINYTSQAMQMEGVYMCMSAAASRFMDNCKCVYISKLDIDLYEDYMCDPDRQKNEFSGFYAGISKHFMGLIDRFDIELREDLGSIKEIEGYVVRETFVEALDDIIDFMDGEEFITICKDKDGLASGYEFYDFEIYFDDGEHDLADTVCSITTDTQSVRKRFIEYVKRGQYLE